MNLLIIGLDSASLAFTLAAIIFLAMGWRRLPGRDIRFVLTALLVFSFVYLLCMWMEWAGISHALEEYENFVGALVPMFWAFAFYAYMQREMLSRLLKSEENIRVTLNSIADGVIATDAEGNINRMNPVAESLTGWPSEEALGKPLPAVFKIFNSRTRLPADNPVDKILKTGKIVGLANHTVLVSKDGAEYQIADSGAPIRNTNGDIIGTVLVFRDVTEEYALRERIVENEQRMQLVIAGAELGTWDWNLKSGQMILNDRWSEMLGYAPGELAPNLETWKTMIHPDDLPHVLEKWNSHLAGETELYQTEHRLKDKDGQWMWFLGKGRVIEWDPAGLPVRACGTHLNIHEQKVHNEQMRQVERIDAIGRLAGGIAHDLNNLLSPILGYGELLLKNASHNSEQRKYIKEILNACLRARDLVSRLLAFCRKQPMNLKSVNINETATGMESLLRRTIPEDIEIKVVKTPDLPMIFADTGQIEQIIMNLAVNAADAMPDGGRLVIETAVYELDKEDVSDRPEVTPGRYVMLAVSDTGCGMDASVRGHIFEPFFSTKGELGTGLGLSTVFGIVKQHNGHIWLYSELNQGTIFKIYLPVAGAEPPREKTPEVSANRSNVSETILLVEDDEPVRKMARQILEREGYTVLTAGDGHEALSRLSAHEGTVHLLITDVVMPGMNGRELYETANQRCPDLKVLYMSGYTDNFIAHRGVIDKEIPFIQKPFTINGLSSRIRDVLKN